ncbi:thioesterase family protein [Proteiniclasticum sp. C24MP]|uniref:thioesterase family protein n=1 Tax=Proteiniclasticum sp. C24MP TaxID=3374101 RepID=UPI00375505A7
MIDELRPGMVYEHSRTVTDKDTAEAHGSGDLAVYATPALVALMEYAAKELVKPRLSEGETTVGVRMEVSHLKATAVGSEVRARAVLLEAEGRKLSFRMEAYDGEILIGEALHERVMVDAERFMRKISK